MTRTGILISACLLGERVRYDGRDKYLADARLQQWQKEGRLFPLCPEVAGGLSTPRAPAELVGGDGYAGLGSRASVVTQDGSQLNKAFINGAQAALSMANSRGLKLALLKANSPSCGNQQVHDGHFSGQLMPGMGVTAALLTQHGIDVFNELQLDQLQAKLMQLDSQLNHNE